VTGKSLEFELFLTEKLRKIRRAYHQQAVGPFSKAAASEDRRRTLWGNAEDLNDARTPLADFSAACISHRQIASPAPAGNGNSARTSMRDGNKSVVKDNIADGS
jgi:hypothetical protein